MRRSTVLSLPLQLVFHAHQYKLFPPFCLSQRWDSNPRFLDDELSVLTTVLQLLLACIDAKLNEHIVSEYQIIMKLKFHQNGVDASFPKP